MQGPPRKRNRRLPKPARSTQDEPQLQKLLAQKTSELESAHLRLRMSDRLASIGALAAGLGHDMNNVLLPIRAHLEAASAGALVPAVRRHVDAVLKSVAYLQQLADGLHFLARDADGDEVEQTATDVSAWWSQVGALLTKAVPKHVQVEVSIQAGLPAVAVSAHGLTQAMLNLVINAGEAMPPPTPRVSAKTRRNVVRIEAKKSQDDAGVTLSVTDNGRGMSEETQRRAFEMFYTTRTRGLGTGLGLPLVARVVSRAGGAVHIESRLGKGSTVSLLLPIAGQPETRSGFRRAVVAITNGRDAEMIRNLLEVTGIRVAQSSASAKADILVVEDTQEGLGAARAWRKSNPRRSLVLFGRPRPGCAMAWKALRPHTVADRTDLEAIRAALGDAIARR